MKYRIMTIYLKDTDGKERTISVPIMEDEMKEGEQLIVERVTVTRPTSMPAGVSFEKMESPK